MQKITSKNNNLESVSWLLDQAFFLQKNGKTITNQYVAQQSTNSQQRANSQLFMTKNANGVKTKKAGTLRGSGHLATLLLYKII